MGEVGLLKEGKRESQLAEPGRALPETTLPIQSISKAKALALARKNLLLKQGWTLPAHPLPLPCAESCLKP